MVSNSNSSSDMNLHFEEESTQTDFSARWDMGRRNSVFGYQFDIQQDASHGLLYNSANYFLQLVCTTLHGVMPRSKINKSTQTCVNPVVCTGEKLARDVVFYFLQEELDLVEDNKLSLCLRSLVSEMLRKHDLLFTRVVNAARITPATAHVAFTEVMNCLFNGGVTWGRIVGSYAFASRLAVYFKEKDMCRLSHSVPLFMNDWIQEKIAPFVEQQGGWEQLRVEFPPEENLNAKVWRYLVITSLVMGIVAVAYSFTKLQPH